MSNIQSQSRLLKVLSNPKRLQIICFLRKNRSGAMNAIAKEIRLSWAGTSKHLQILRLAGIVEHKKRGLFVTYRLSLPQQKIVKQVLSVIK